jgi:hypothetical protein
MASSNHVHQFELVKYPFTGNLVQIDVALVPLIKQIWSQNIQTIGCCQELIDGVIHRKILGQGYSWIRFKTDDDFNRFVKFVSNDHKISDCKKRGKDIYFKIKN